MNNKLVAVSLADKVEFCYEDDQSIISSRYTNHLHDESRLHADHVSSISFPKCTAEVAAAISRFAELHQPISISGARTGLCGGAVAEQSANIISLEKVKFIESPQISSSGATIKVGAGVTLSELQNFLIEHLPQYFFPVDPTEMSATIGGAINTNASGARSLYYGSMRRWVDSITVVLPTGHLFNLRRGEVFIVDNQLVLSRDGKEDVLSERTIPKPQSKNVIGYNFCSKLDLIDLFIGSEGTLGVVTEAVLRLEKLPTGRLYFLQFFRDEKQAFSFAESLRKVAFDILALEFFDNNSLQIVGRNRAKINSRAAQMISEQTQAAIFCDIIVETEEKFVEIYEELEQLLDSFGASIEESIAGAEDKDLRDIKAFRHAVPESINSLLAERKKDLPQLHKISTDMSVPADSFQEMNSFYKSQLDMAGLEYYMFGHLGEYHLHINIVPRSNEELAVAKDLYRKFAEKVVALGGAVAAEHGIGRIKKSFMQIQYPPEVLETMRNIKRFFDPEWLLNRGVLLDEQEVR